MAGLGKTFDATSIDTTQRDYENLPNGTYVLEVTASEVKPTSRGDGTILKLTYDVVEPDQFKGRKIFANMNLENPNPTAQEIGQRELAALCRATGLDSIEDSEQLHFIGFTAKVGMGKPSKDGQHAAKNEVKKFYFPDEGNIPDAAIDADAAPTPANDNRPAANTNSRPAAAAPAATGSRPWKKQA
jgi:hypothetical protein